MLPAMSTPRPTALDDVGALGRGLGWVARGDLRTWSVSGTDALRWLDDLVTVRVALVDRSTGRDGLLLTPTGHVRAAFRIARTSDGDLLLVQADDQPVTVAAALAPYVLSSDVRIEPVATWIASVPHGDDPPPGAMTPSIEETGWDLIAAPSGEAAARRLLEGRGLREVTRSSLEELRIREGRARFPIDLDERSIPAEAGWSDRIDADKGCFLGQESVAKVRNLGHPARVVIAVAAEGPITTGDEVSVAGEVTGIVTSASADGLRALVRVAWSARGADLRTVSGVRLSTERPSVP